jgi:hypothetical protein
MRERYMEFRRRTLEEWERNEQAKLRAAPVPFYALPPAFQGPRTIETYQIAAGGREFGDVNTETVHYQLIHGGRQQRPLRFLIVATSEHPEPPRRPTPLRHYLWEHVAMEMVASRGRPRWRVGRISFPKRQEVGGAERPMVVPIDAGPRTFTLLEEGQVQVAELVLPDHRILLQAHRWPIERVALVTVTDLTPFLENWRRDRARLRARLGIDERNQ